MGEQMGNQPLTNKGTQTIVIRCSLGFLSNSKVKRALFLPPAGGYLQDPVSSQRNPLCVVSVGGRPQFGCGSRIGTQNETLLNGNMDDLTCGPIPSELILTHIHLTKAAAH